MMTIPQRTCASPYCDEVIHAERLRAQPKATTCGRPECLRAYRQAYKRKHDDKHRAHIKRYRRLRYLSDKAKAQAEREREAA